MGKSVIVATFGAVLASGFLMVAAPAAHASICANMGDYHACYQQIMSTMSDCIKAAEPDQILANKCADVMTAQQKQLDAYMEDNDPNKDNNAKVKPPDPNCPDGTPNFNGFCSMPKN
jgi:hypothetical protein